MTIALRVTVRPGQLVEASQVQMAEAILNHLMMSPTAQAQMMAARERWMEAELERMIWGQSQIQVTWDPEGMELTLRLLQQSHPMHRRPRAHLALLGIPAHRPRPPLR